MTALQELKKKGYSVTKDSNSGKVIAKKGGQTYSASSYTALKKQLLGSSVRGVKKKVSKPKNNAAMATRRKTTKRAAPKKRRVSGVRTTTRTTTTRKRTKAVGAVVDRHMVMLAAGMALKSTVDAMLIQPLTARIPGQFAMLVEPGKAVLGYYATKHFKSPIVQGVALGVMADGVNGSVKMMLGKLPMLNMSRPMQQPGNVSGYYSLPSPALGAIPQYLGTIPQMLGNINNSSMPNIGDIDPGDEMILPLGWNK